MLIAKGTDFQVIHDLGKKYNALVDEKFALIDRLKSESMFIEQRINMRLQLAELHHNILRTDNLRNAIAFGFKYELLSESRHCLRKEIEKELFDRDRAYEKELHDKIEILRNRLEEEKSKNSTSRIMLYEANRKLKSNGLQPVMKMSRESFNTIIEPALNNH